jgi:malonyl-CoA O-methyltransferase
MSVIDPQQIDPQQIARRFSAAADYDRHARVQRVAARRLAERIAGLPLPPAPRILEIGCGTGFLTQALVEHGLAGEWLITDVSPAMIERCRARIGGAHGRRFAVLDGEYGDPGGRYDLVCSSLAVQWFDDQPAALARMRQWLRPGGHSIHTTLGAGSFAEWRSAHAAEGLAPGTPRFLPAERFSPLSVERHVERHSDALTFMRSLKAIGAHTSPRGHRPLSPDKLRRVMRRFEAAGSAISYEVVTCHYQQP